MWKTIKNRYVLVGILLFGFIVRIIGFNWGGDGMLFHPDEASVVDPIIKMVENVSLIHSDWTYPSMSSSKLLAAILFIITRFIRIDWIYYYYIVRIFYVLISVAILFLSYRLVEMIEESRTALAFTFLLALNPIHVRYSKMAVGDTPVMLFWLIVALAMQNYISSRNVKTLVLMSFFAACSMLEKWNGAGITIYIAIGVIVFNRKDIKKMIAHAVISFGTFVLFILLMAPNIIVEFQSVLDAIFTANPWLGRELIQRQFTFFFAYVGIGSFLLMMIGLFRLFTQLNSDVDISRKFPLLLAVVSLFVDWILCHEQVERHGFIIQWGCLLMIVVGFEFLIGQGRTWKWTGYIIMSLAVCSWILGTVLACSVAVKTKKHDTRVVGAKILESMGATVSNTIADNYTPYIPPYGLNVVNDAYIYDNMINDTIYSDEEGNPCISLPDKKFAVSGEYSWPDWNSGGYAVLKENAELVKEITADVDIDMVMNYDAQGGWNVSEFDTIRRTYLRIVDVWKAGTIGGRLSVYDISGFAYKPMSQEISEL